MLVRPLALNCSLFHRSHFVNHMTYLKLGGCEKYDILWQRIQFCLKIFVWLVCVQSVMDHRAANWQSFLVLCLNGVIRRSRVRIPAGAWKFWNTPLDSGLRLISLPRQRFSHAVKRHFYFYHNTIARAICPLVNILFKTKSFCVFFFKFYYNLNFVFFFFFFCW